MSLIKYKLESLVPLRAKRARILYSIKPEYARLMIYSTPDDEQPQLLTGKRGEIAVDLIEPQTVYVQPLSDVHDYDIACTGWGS